MKTVLITGATGFLGSHLLESLIEEGYSVVILKRSTSNTWRINHILEKVASYDIDKQSIQIAFEQQKIDTVIHTACHYGRNQDSLTDIVESNLMFALRVLETAIFFKVNTFINTDTALPKYKDSYSLSKYQFSEWLKKFSNKIQCINIKLDHMYGPKDDKSKFIYWLLERMINSQDEIPLTQGNQKRNFVYVGDVVAAYMLLLDNANILPEWDEFDVGESQLITVKDFILTLQKAVENLKMVNLKGRLNFGAISYRGDDIMEPSINNSKIVRMGWHPKMNLNDGIKKILKEF